MSAYAILRTQKLKSPVAVRRSMMHAFRAQTTPNADPSRTPGNTHIGANSVDEGLAKFSARLPDKVRSNAVLAIEYLVTASPEAMQGKSQRDQDLYFRDALNWLRERHGAENVVYAGIHRDETTPHMYAYVVPLDERGKLNCRAFLGGSKALSDMQTEFAQRVGRQHGFERGIERSRAQHTTVREFYAALDRAGHDQARFTPDQVEPQVVEKRLLGRDVVESPQQVAERLNTAMQKHYAPAIAEAATARLERRRAGEMAKTAKGWADKASRLEKALQPFQELAKVSRDKFVELVQQATKLTAALRAEKKISPNRGVEG